MKNPVLFVLSVLVLGAIYFTLKNPNLFRKPDADPPKGAMTMSVADFRDKLAEIRMDKDKLERSIKQLEEMKSKSLDLLKEFKITKVADAKGKPEAEVALKSLSDATKQIADLKPQLGDYDTAISRISGILDKLERERVHSEVKLTEEQQIELGALVKGLNERLEIGKNDMFEDEAIDELLKENGLNK